ncbi:hypothetical protein ACOMHN_018808 [Nucella lapillus]
MSGVDDRKMMEDVRRLQAEVNSLRSENSHLKSSSMTLTSSPASAFPPVVYIIATIIIGLLIGKLIL